MASVLTWKLGIRGPDLDIAYHVFVVHRQDFNALQEQKTVGHEGDL